MNDNEQSPQAFFEELLAETAKQFKNSPICKHQMEKSEQWNYSICDTPILKNRPILFGINWGGVGIKPQMLTTQWGDITEYPFIKRIKSILEHDLKFNFSNIDFNYTNFCFFRSPRASDLQEDDYKLSIPLFEKYVRYINPQWLLSIGNTSFQKLRQYGLLQDIVQYESAGSKVNGYFGKLWNYDIYSVPHPNAHLSNGSRAEIWACAIKEINGTHDLLQLP
jgi:hypothetical protein